MLEAPNLMSIVFIFQLQHKIERNEREFEFKPLTDDVYAVSSLLKVSHPRICVMPRSNPISFI